MYSWQRSTSHLQLANAGKERVKYINMVINLNIKICHSKKIHLIISISKRHFNLVCNNQNPMSLKRQAWVNYQKDYNPLIFLDHTGSLLILSLQVLAHLYTF